MHSPITTFAAVAIACLAAATADSAFAADTRSIANFDVTEVAPGNYVHYGSFDERSADNLGDNANIGFIVGDQCVLAVDAGGSLPVGRALRQAIRRVTPLPVCYVVLTHVHPDHFFGAAAFLDDHAQFIAHENYPAQLAARARSYVNSLQRDLGTAAAGSEIVGPTLLVRERLELDLGGRTVVMQAWPPAHTDDDLTVFDAPTRTLWLSDLLFVGHTPVIDGTITGFLAVMKDLRTIAADHYMPGHGRSDLPWPKALDAQQRYFTVILDETRAAIRSRKTIQQATDEVGLSEAGNWAAFDLFHRRNVTTAFAELEWE
ncbi:MAG: quinoprotein relay system zinc metallohydrolase 2 [Betaproteobacteria bacterium]|nr:quinoprotein relay system zinc metallohydrolase 2 [Betaproteobacteria bacterium]